MKEYWELHKKSIVTTAICAFVALFVIKFFDAIFFGAFVIAICVAAVLAWNHLSDKYGGPAKVWEAVRKAIWEP